MFWGQLGGLGWKVQQAQRHSRVSTWVEQRFLQRSYSIAATHPKRPIRGRSRGAVDPVA